MHVGQKFVALAGTLADTCEDRDPLVFLDHRMDQFHDQHGLADPRAAEHCGLAAAGERRQQINHLDAGFEDCAGGRFVFKRRRWIVDTPTRGIGRQGRAAVPNSSDNVEETPENRIADRHRNGCAGRTHLRVARQTCCCLKRDASDRNGIDMAVHFEDQRLRPIPFDDQRTVDGRQRLMLEADVNDGAAN